MAWDKITVTLDKDKNAVGHVVAYHDHGKPTESEASGRVDFADEHDVAKFVAAAKATLAKEAVLKHRVVSMDIEKKLLKALNAKSGK